MPNDLTPSPLEGIEIPHRNPMSDEEIATIFKQPGTYTAQERNMACELAERRLADRDTIRIPKDVAERMARYFETQAVEFWSGRDVGRSDSKSGHYECRRYAAILRGEKTDAK